ncbi:MAG: hypothetical protein L6R38_007245 [Xanthoria sp. 2 TBL-2021]|nr:MAG: hypothetical protein L6R38_007245 [Xanthoria sp. 2 TBL-2021]
MSAADSSEPTKNTPDIMNDPAFDPTRDGKRKKSVDEADTCRICRSEAAKDEPLFYPCKCSGSIKFVHQHCLMEWLSHSQKKHCELCKTPFRFTKLYHPQMPATVPTLVFLRQVVLHTWSSLVATSRLHLVAFVWLCWLPWSMRTVWRGLFWLGDGGWMDWVQMEQEALKAAKAHVDQLAAEGSSPAFRDFFPGGLYGASTVMSRIADAFPQRASQTLNLTQGEPVVFGLARALFRHIIRGHRDTATSQPERESFANATHVASIPYRSSWLSDVGFLKTLTSYPILNNIVIDTMEGQLITMFIVIAFILIFLIREWVVQQQPGVNLLAVIEPREPVRAIEDVNGAANDPVGPIENAEEAPAEAIAAANDADSQQPYQVDMSGQETSEDREESSFALGRDPVAASDSNPEQTSALNDDVTNHQQRPSMPDRCTLARAAEIRRTIEEQSRIEGPDWSGLEVFMDLWTRTNNDPRRVLAIIEDKGDSEQLAWIVAAMRRLEKIPSTARDQNGAQLAANAEDPTSRGDPQANVASRDADAHDPDLARMIQEPDFDFANGLGGNDSLDDASNSTERGSSVPLMVPDEVDNTNTGEENLQANESSGTGSIPSDHVEDSTTDPGSVPVQETRDAPAPGNNNPFHPDYIGPLPSHPHEESAGGQPDSSTNTMDDNIHTNEPNPLIQAQADGTQAIPVSTRANQGFIDKVLTWLWGEPGPNTTANNDQAAADVELVVQDLANEAPFVPMEHGQPMLEDHHNGDREADAQPVAQDPEAVADAVQAGLDPNDPEAIEEIEDLEGVMELIGMQGPIAGLIQNGMFCAVLVSLTIFVAIWVPYTMGKLFLLILASPVSLLLKMPFWYAQALADFFSDAVVLVITWAYYWVATAINTLCSPLRKFQIISYLLHGDTILAEVAWSYATRSKTRLGDTLTAMIDSHSQSDVPTFSIMAHESLRSLQQQVSQIGQLLVSSAVASCTWRFDTTQVYRSLQSFEDYQELAAYSTAKLWLLLDAVKAEFQNGLASLAALRQFNIFRINVTLPPRTQPPDFTLAYWDTRDRALAILFGYMFFALLGVGYLWLSPLFQGRRRGEKVDGIMAEILYQAGGVLKVILIISIEMIVFPLYCGLLLDVALLPLFGHVTIFSRLEFTVHSPYTSLFVHWFVGTCYMFHFALFVSMCRKIMRTGVLYFIRDPDDPTFHPVRDVLERSVFIQLCKIAFSALVYGGLVIVCLGSVVWGISSAFDGVFPIHWSSNEPVLEFPVDLLFYNFLMPLAVRVFKPAEGLTKMYGWWFKACARGLRLSHFLFGDKREDEEGRHIRRTWKGVFAGNRGDTKNPVIGKEQQKSIEDQGRDAYFLRDGRYVRTPASDQVRIPKGAHTFLEVDEAGNRVDGLAENDEGLHGRNNSKFVTIYIPPHFRLRICAFLGLLWLFAAATGVCFTVIPLVFGRYVFSNIFPFHPRMNDVYAFCIGVNILGGIGFALLNARFIFHHLRHTFVPTRESNASKILQRNARYAARLARVLYTYTAFGVLLPGLVALVVELYFIVPLHTFFSTGVADRHVIYLIQDWTLGVLYVKMIGRFVFWYEGSRAAIALRNIIRDGWTDPDIRLATRGFIFPATVMLCALLATPLGAGWIVNRWMMFGVDPAVTSAVYRYSYPCFLGQGVGIGAMYYAAKAFKGWKRRIRDEVYLIGERLHNFGERKTPAVVGGSRVGM